MSDRTYWLHLFTGKTWQEFLDAGEEVSGFRESRWKTVQRIKSGDYLLCYLTGVSRWIGVLEVTSKPFRDDSPIWKDESFPCRVRVKIVAQLTPETAVPVFQLRDRLSIFQNLKSPHAWTGRFRGSPSRWKASDGRVVVDAIMEAERNPVVRPVDQAKLRRRPRALRAKIGSVTVPEAEEAALPAPQPATEVTPHTEMQWLLLKLGTEMGLDVWVARNDRGKEYDGHRFADLPGIVEELPLQFDDATTRTIELIDVLWLKKNAILAAFEIESTTRASSEWLTSSPCNPTSIFRYTSLLLMSAVRR